MARAGNAKPVYRVANGQLYGNGGNIKIIGNVAMRAKFVDDDVAVSGKPKPVYIVTDADLVENGGPFKLVAGEPLKLKTISGEPVRGGNAIPVYDIDPAPTSEVVLFFDTFTDANGVLIDSHAPDIDTVGGGWSFILGEAQIQGNEYRTTTNPARSVADCGDSDVEITLDIISINNEPNSIIARVQDTNNLWGIDVLVTNLRVVEVIGGGGNVRASTPITRVVFQDYPIKANLVGQTITATFNNNETAVYGLATNLQSLTVHGIGGTQLVNSDNFKVVSA